ncbi:MAG TPA: 6-phosphogluconolactonase [Acidimicrobiia bacterium]
MDVVVFADQEAASAGAARMMAGAIRSAETETVSIGLAGGTTPATAYRLLLREDLGWERVHGWPADERWVPKDHPDNNGFLAQEALFRWVPAQLHRPMWAPWLEPPEAAAYFDAELRSLHAGGGPEVVLLGLGEDGHTASLFPSADTLDVDGRWYVATEVAALKAWRLTATIDLLSTAARILFLATGEGKAMAVSQVLEENSELPAAIVSRCGPHTTWALDSASASQLSPGQYMRAPA